MKTSFDRQEFADQGPVDAVDVVPSGNLMRASMMERELYLDRLAAATLSSRSVTGR